MRKIIKRIVGRIGYSLKKKSEEYLDITDLEFWNIYNECRQYTMTSVERMYSLFCSVDYILKNHIEGDFVECGVWRGGSSMLIAQMLNSRKIFDRKIYLYDTFEGMPAPTADDSDIFGKGAEMLMRKQHENEKEAWCLADLRDVQNNFKKTGFPEENVVYIKGKVEDTIPKNLPGDKIALIRLDTDWYESTKHELIYLYPRLEMKGVLLIDDYGYWTGCRKAVDEYFFEKKIYILLNRIDNTGRIAIKISEPEFSA